MSRKPKFYTTKQMLAWNKRRKSRRVVLAVGYGWIGGCSKGKEGHFEMKIYKPIPKYMSGKKILLIAEVLDE